MTLAYIFWHTPAEGLEADAYEAALGDFHQTLSVPSASFRLARLPFDPGGADPSGTHPGAGYEDWYLVDDWRKLGELNAEAVAAARRAPHDAAARLSAHGWGGVFALKLGPVEPPRTARWTDKPPGEAYDDFMASLDAAGIWQRQMVLGPAPEFCLVDPRGASADDRIPVVYRV